MIQLRQQKITVKHEAFRQAERKELTAENAGFIISIMKNRAL